MKQTEKYNASFCGYNNWFLLSLLSLSLSLPFQAVHCPLCQVKLPHLHLQHHLTHVHSVAQDCVDKLISAVSAHKCVCVFVAFAFFEKARKTTRSGERWGDGG